MEMMMDRKREKLDSAVGLLKLLSHPVRLSILCNLIHNGEMSVTEIVESEAGAAGQSQISQFLGKMRSEGLVKNRKEAQTVFYKIDSPQAKKVVQALYDIYCGKS
jgi:ArsR family transcriptional regulator, virulence genes transcriptional regulator